MIRLLLAAILSVSLLAGDETERLATLGKVWFEVKYLHPYLAYREADWDQALSAAIPKVKAATGPDEFAAAVDSMLRTLDDPMTHIAIARDSEAGPPGDLPFMSSERRADGVVIVTLNSTHAPPGWGTVRSEFRRLHPILLDAKGIVIDLRMQSNDEVRRWLLLNYFDTLGPALLEAAVDGPGLRTRLHKGWPSSLDASSGGMFSAFVTRAGRRFSAGRDAQTPIAFVVNRWSPFPSIAAALHSAGRAAVVFEGEGSIADGSETMRIPLEEQWEAVIRLDEMIFPDGGAVPEPSIRADDNRALRRALEYVEEPTRLTVSRKSISVVPLWRETTTRQALDEENPYPPAEQRLLAAFKIWGIFEYFYPYRHLMDDDWWEVLKRIIPKVESASDAMQYYMAITEMVHYTHDSHMVSPYNRRISALKGMFSPRVVLRMIEGGLTVIHAGAETGLKTGDVVHEIDGVGALDLMGQQSRFRSTSTPQALRFVLALTFLRGQEGSHVTLRVEDKSGVTRSVTLSRDTPVRRAGNMPDGPRDPVEVLKSGVGYVDLSRLPASQVDSMIERLDPLPAIIFDLRRGGRTVGREIVSRLIMPERDGDRIMSYRIPGFQGRSLMYPNLQVDFLGHRDQAMGSVAPWIMSSQKHWPYEGKTALLINGSLRSNLEGLASAFRYANGAVLIGGPTQGANGDVTRFTIPGGITIPFTGVELWYGERQQQQQIGVVPDIYVEPSLAGIRAGRDEVLERAIEELKQPIQ